MAFKTIKLKDHSYIQEEAVTAEAITPGHLVALNSSSQIAKHAVSGGNCERLFAFEDELQGKDIDDDYASGARAQYLVCRPGDEVYALLKNGENVSVGDKLQSAGDGTLEAFGGDSSGVVVENTPIAVAMEAVDMSGSSAADPSGRIRVRIM